MVIDYHPRITTKEAHGNSCRMRILLVEDDPQMGGFIEKGLSEQGYTVDRASDGKEGLLLAATENYDALIVDRMLPKLDGLALLRILRTSGNETPVLILSALGETQDRVDGLRAGSDDYLPKPFAFSELSARLEALLRRVRHGALEETILRVGGLEMNLLTRTVKRNTENISLQPREFRLLEYLMRHADQVVTRTMLLEQVWDYHFDPQTNVIDVHISRLRTKIDRNFEPKLLQTVWGAGYRLCSPP